MFWNKRSKSVNLDLPMIELGREIERGLLLLWTLIANHWEKNGHSYHKLMDSKTDKLLKDKTIINEEIKEFLIIK